MTQPPAGISSLRSDLCNNPVDFEKKLLDVHYAIDGGLFQEKIKISLKINIKT